MASTTPAPPSHHRASSRAQIPSRPTTPLRPPSRTSLRASQSTPHGNSLNQPLPDFPLNSLEPAFAELSDSMADLEANFMHLQLLNESLGRFNENFGAFLYGLNMSAFCVDFPEAPIAQSFARHPAPGQTGQAADSPFRQNAPPPDVEATFLTTDTSFVENPPTSSRPASKYSATPASRPSTASGRGGRGVGRGRGVPGAGSTRGARGASRVARGSGVGRGRGSVR